MNDISFIDKPIAVNGIHIRRYQYWAQKKKKNDAPHIITKLLSLANLYFYNKTESVYVGVFV